MNTSPIRLLIILAMLTSAVLFGCGGSSSDDLTFIGGGEVDPTPSPSDPNPSDPNPSSPPDTESGRVWSIAEVLSEPRTGGAGGSAQCGGEFGFKRCVCAENVRSSMRYRPALTECNGNAAAILDGEYLNAFSIVVRDSQNRDRWPAAGSGFGGCSAALANSESPPNSCSAFKVQEKIEVAGGAAVVHCFGASGYSNIFSDVVRVTIKNSDDPFSSDDDIDRLCLSLGSLPLN